MRIYISGPISGAQDIPDAVKRERFNTMEMWLGSQGDVDQIVNPLKIGACIELGFEERCDDNLENIYTHTWDCWMRYDLKAMLNCNAIVMLPRWEASPGAIMELNIAVGLKFRVFHATKIYGSDPWGWRIEEQYYTQTTFDIPKRMEISE